MQWLSEIEERIGKSTAGPWKVFETSNARGNVIGRGIGTEWDHPQLHGPAPVFSTAHGVEGVYPYVNENDATFIIHAHSDIARLIHAVKVAEKALVHIIHEVRGNGRNLTGAEIHVEDYAVKKLAQLQSGEFGEVR